MDSHGGRRNRRDNLLDVQLPLRLREDVDAVRHIRELQVQFDVGLLQKGVRCKRVAGVLQGLLDLHDEIVPREFDPPGDLPSDAEGDGCGVQLIYVLITLEIGSCLLIKYHRYLTNS